MHILYCPYEVYKYFMQWFLVHLFTPNTKLTSQNSNSRQPLQIAFSSGVDRFPKPSQCCHNRMTIKVDMQTGALTTDLLISSVCATEIIVI